MSTDNELFDFGFTLVDENELGVQKAQETVASSSESANATQDRLDKLFGGYPTTSEQFKKRIPKKEYILFNRLEKIEQFEDHIQKIYKD